MLIHKIILIFTILVCVTVYADETKTLLVLDMKNISQLPRNFRATSKKLPKTLNTTGFSELHIAGGGQYSELSLQKILQTLQVKNMIVFDLRQESHGFLNGNAISWFAPRNAINANKTDAEITQDENNLLQNLRGLNKVDVHDILQKSNDQFISKTQIIKLPVKQVLSEASLTKKYDLEYHRIYVQDFHAPKPDEVDRFIKIAKQLPKDEWVYFHCRAGVGRTTTFMVLFDMMRNAKNVSFEDILARQKALGGKDLTQLPKVVNHRYHAAVKRLAFLEGFYVYARNNRDDFRSTWSAWVKSR